MAYPSITMYSPLWLGALPIVNGIKHLPESYKHAIDVGGGYESCSFSLNCSMLQAEDWFMSLGNHIEIHSDGLNQIWEGFVNKIEISAGDISVSRGPLMDVVNKVTVSYSEVNRGYNLGGVNVNLGGEQLYTTPYNDTVSQATWGVLEEILSAGSLNPGEINYLPQAYVDDNKNPHVSQDINLSGGGGEQPTVSISCRGYADFLEKYIYSETVAGAATIDLSQKIQNILADDPNGIFSTDYSKIASNTTAVTRYDDKYKTAKSAINELMPLGDSSFNRYIWGVYNDRVVKYNAVPTTIRYSYSILDGKSRVSEIGGAAEVNPWEVLPGYYILISNLLPGIATNTSDIKKDPRIMFIESVSYSAPYGVQLSGGKTDTISQRMNRLGLGNF